MRGEQVAGRVPRAAAPSTDDGWFPTNDGGHLDEDGYLFVEGRLDDVIVRGGENMSPGEIEDVLLEHPAVADAAVDRRPRRRVGRGRRRRRGAAPGASRHRGRAAGLGARAAALVADARGHRLPRRAALQRDRQAAAPELKEDLATVVKDRDACRVTCRTRRSSGRRVAVSLGRTPGGPHLQTR